VGLLSLRQTKSPSSFILVIVVPAAICLYLYAAHFQVAALIHDDGIYIVSAKSLYQGTGYSIASLPDSPPQTKYPPVFPLLLSLCWHANPSFPENIVLMRFFSALCAVLVLFMAFFYLRLKSSYHPHPALPLQGGGFGLYAFLFLSALAFNPYFAFLSGQIMSEMPFTLFSLASLSLFLHYERHGDKTSLYGSLLLAAIAFYTRSIGIALFLSFLLWFLYRRRFRTFLGVFTFMLLATIPWSYWAYKNAPPVADCLVTAYYHSYLSWFFLTLKSSSYFPNLPLIFSLPGLLSPSVKLYPVSVSTILSFIVVLFFWLFFLKGIIYQVRKCLSVDTFYLLVTMAIVAIWPLGMDTERFLLPVLPIVLFHLMEGVKAVRKDVATFPLSYRNVGRPLWQLSVAVLLVGVYVLPIWRTTALVRKPFHCEALFRCMEEASDWIGNNTERKDVIASEYDPLVYLLSERHSVNVAWANPFAAWQSVENAYGENDILMGIKKYKVSYLLIYVGLWSGEGELLRNKKFAEIMKKYPDAFHKCYEKKEAFAIYRVERQYLEEKHDDTQKGG